MIDLNHGFISYLVDCDYMIDLNPGFISYLVDSDYMIDLNPGFAEGMWDNQMNTKADVSFFSLMYCPFSFSLTLF